MVVLDKPRPEVMVPRAEQTKEDCKHMATLSIPISKAGKGVNFDVEFDMEAMPDDTLKAIIVEGLKAMLNARMSKLPAPSTIKDATELELAKEEALAKAAENWADLQAGKLTKRTTGAKASKEGKEVLTEALRQCKEVVRDRLKAARVRISTVAAKDITAAAQELLKSRNDFYIAKAKQAIADRIADAEGTEIALPKEDPKKVAELEAEKATRKAATSAKQAGMTTKRAGKGKGPVPPRKGDTPSHQTAH
jgi:hypothetical protein